MKSITLSVIIPCYNHGAYLPEAVESVRLVQRDDVEMIIVDDGSTDERTKQEMDRLTAEGLHVIRQKNSGLAAARNTAVAAARGRYILPLDADNRIHPQYISEGIRILDNDPRTGVVYGDANYIGTRQGRWRVKRFDQHRLMRMNYIDACAVYRRQIWEQNGGYDGKMPVQGYEDWDFWLGAIAAKWQFAYVPKIMFDYRVLPNSMITGARERYAAVVDYILAKHARLYADTFFAMTEPNVVQGNELACGSVVCGEGCRKDFIFRPAGVALKS